jgi:hypothetical protein
MSSRRFPTFTLLEASQDYEAMFREITTNERCDDRTRREISEGIAWARKVLKKQDRVVWWLRYLKAIMLATIQDSDQARRTVARDYIRTWDDKTTVENAQTIISGTGKDLFEHWFSLDYVKIQNYVMAKKPYEQVRTELKEIEKEYVERANAKIKHDDPSLQGTEVIVDCGGGWYWVNLHRPACPVEGKAMGHCGNSPRSDSDDTVLSLRKYKEKKDGTSYWEPHLTFTIDEGGELMEMKGRGNKKPAPQYHEMIVKLLLYTHGGEHLPGGEGTYLVNDLVGGSWLPENDFSIEDLSPELKKKLLTARPDLGNIFEFVEYGGNLKSSDMALKLRQYSRRHPFINHRPPDWFDWMGNNKRLVFNCPLGHGPVRPAITGNFNTNELNWSALSSDPIMASFGLFHREKDIERYRANASEEMITDFQTKWRAYVVKTARGLLEAELGDASAFCTIVWPLEPNPRKVEIVIDDPVAFITALRDRLKPPMVHFIKVANYFANMVKFGKLIDLGYQVDAAFSRLVNGRGESDPPA